MLCEPRPRCAGVGRCAETPGEPRVTTTRKYALPLSLLMLLTALLAACRSCFVRGSILTFPSTVFFSFFSSR